MSCCCASGKTAVSNTDNKEPAPAPAAAPVAAPAPAAAPAASEPVTHTINPLMPGFSTLCLHGGWKGDPATTAAAVPVYRTAPFKFNDTKHAANLFALAELGNIYSRLMNPTTDVLEKRVALLEGSLEPAGLAVASGTSANFYALINIAKIGDNIVASRQLYGGTYTMLCDIFPTMGIEVRFVDGNDPAAFAAAADDKTRAFFCETCSNPALEVVDLEAVAAAGAAMTPPCPLVVDATFSTPWMTKPLAHGAAVVVHSLTKWLSGHGTSIGGIVIDGCKFDWTGGRHPVMDEPDPSYHGLRWAHDLPAPLKPLSYILKMRTGPLRNLGACISPDNSWMALQGIETLPLRMERHCENSLKVAKFLEKQPSVEWVRYPGLETDKYYELQKKYLRGKGGSMVVFGVKGGAAAGSKFIDNLKLFSHVANVGDAKSLAIHPATTTHSQLSPEDQAASGVKPELIRLSVGIEDFEDLTEDLTQALAASQ